MMFSEVVEVVHMLMHIVLLTCELERFNSLIPPSSSLSTYGSCSRAVRYLSYLSYLSILSILSILLYLSYLAYLSYLSNLSSLSNLSNLAICLSIYLSIYLYREREIAARLQRKSFQQKNQSARRLNANGVWNWYREWSLDGVALLLSGCVGRGVNRWVHYRA